jgi:uncharacterized protein
MTQPDIVVHKLDAHGREIWHYTGHLLEDGPLQRRLIARFDREQIEVGGLTLARGDVFLETFYADRWYNVFDVYDPAGRRKGWYCNVARPARFLPRHIYAEDLALDLVVLPGGLSVVLDEEEFDALLLTEGEVRASRQALAELRELIRTHSGPFGEPASPLPFPPA